MLGEGKMEKGDLGDRDASRNAVKRQPVIWALESFNVTLHPCILVSQAHIQRHPRHLEPRPGPGTSPPQTRVTVG